VAASGNRGDAVAEQAIKARRVRWCAKDNDGLSRGPIAAICLERGYALATCNTGDFAWIDELKLFNSLKTD
jgi:predicted nucleic acid-binding protein